MIQIAIVTPAVAARAKPRRDNDDSPEIHKGSVWTQQGERIGRRCLECVTPNGVRLELEALFERYDRKSICVRLIEPLASVQGVAKAITGLLAMPVHHAAYSYKKFMGRRGDPFALGFGGREYFDFRPAWVVPAEPMILLKSSGGDHYTYPSTDDNESEETTHVRNGRAGGLTKQANRLRKEEANRNADE